MIRLLVFALATCTALVWHFTYFCKFLPFDFLFDQSKTGLPNVSFVDNSFTSTDGLRPSVLLSELSTKVLPGISFKRYVQVLSKDWVSQITVDFAQHCSKMDEYGGNQCHYDWGETLTIDITSCNITSPLTDKIIIKGSFKVSCNVMIIYILH